MESGENLPMIEEEATTGLIMLCKLMSCVALESSFVGGAWLSYWMSSKLAVVWFTVVVSG